MRLIFVILTILFCWNHAHCQPRSTDFPRKKIVECLNRMANSRMLKMRLKVLVGPKEELTLQSSDGQTADWVSLSSKELLSRPVKRTTEQIDIKQTRLLAAFSKGIMSVGPVKLCELRFVSYKGIDYVRLTIRDDRGVAPTCMPLIYVGRC